MFAYLSFLAVLLSLSPIVFLLRDVWKAGVIPNSRALFCLFLYNDVLGLLKQSGSFVIVAAQVTLQKEDT